MTEHEPLMLSCPAWGCELTGVVKFKAPQGEGTKGKRIYFFLLLSLTFVSAQYLLMVVP